MQGGAGGSDSPPFLFVGETNGGYKKGRPPTSWGGDAIVCNVPFSSTSFERQMNVCGRGWEPSVAARKAQANKRTPKSLF